MNKQDWALKLIGPHTLHDKKVGPVINFPRAVKLLKAEHARSVRILKRFQKAGRESVAMSPSAKAGYELACKQVLAALTKGRGKGRK